MAVTYRLDGGVGHIELAGPRGNAISLELLDQFAESVRAARRDDVGVLVLTAAPGPFCVGGDIGAFAGSDDVGQLVDDLADGMHRVIADLRALDAVVVSVVRGVAAGAGVALAAAADLVLASDRARFTFGYTKLGFSPDGGTALLAATLGLHTMLRLTLLNPVITAEEAQQLGLVAEVRPEDEIDAAVTQVVEQLRRGSRAAQVSTVRLVRAVATPDPEGAMRRETVSIRQLAASADGVEGVAAFLAKRPPVFGATAH